MNKVNKAEEVATMATKALKGIAVALGIEQTKEHKFETLTLGDGDEQATLEADAFEAGQAVFVLDPEGNRVPLPVGEYPTEIGLIVVSEEGMIAEVRTQDEEEVVEEAPMEQAEAEVAKAPKKVVESISTETHFSKEQKESLDLLFTELKQDLFSKIEGLLSVGDEVELLDGTHELENKDESIEVKNGKVEAIVETKPAKHSMSKQTSKKLIHQEGKTKKSRLINFHNNRK